MQDHGCQLRGQDIVLIPGDLVEASIRAAPSCAMLYDRLGRERCGWRGASTTTGWAPTRSARRTSAPGTPVFLCYRM